MPAKDQVHLAFGESLKAWRQQRGYSQQALAKRVGVSTSFIGMLERGEKTTTLDQLGKIAAGLRVDIRDLFRADDESPSTHRQVDILVRKITADASDAELRLFLGVCELFATYLENK